MILSILIPSIPERKNKLDNLLNELNRQKKSYEVEILTSVTEKYIEGGLSVGAKRDLLVQKAKGKYLCFLDDDDYLSPDYLDSIIEYTKQNTDVITFKSQIIKFHQFKIAIFIHNVYDFILLHNTFGVIA